MGKTAQRRSLERMVGPQVAGYVRERRINLDHASEHRSWGDVDRAKVFEAKADAYAREACDLLEALRPNVRMSEPPRETT